MFGERNKELEKAVEIFCIKEQKSLIEDEWNSPAFDCYDVTLHYDEKGAYGQRMILGVRIFFSKENGLIATVENHRTGSGLPTSYAWGFKLSKVDFLSSEWFEIKSKKVK